MGSHFTSGLAIMGRVAFSLELLEWDRKCLGFGGSENIQVGREMKNGKIHFRST